MNEYEFAAFVADRWPDAMMQYQLQGDQMLVRALGIIGYVWKAAGVEIIERLVPNTPEALAACHSELAAMMAQGMVPA